MADSSNNLCYIVTLAAAAGIVIFGFMMLLQKQQPTENDVQVLQRQMRGFAYLLLAQIVLLLGMSLCVGLQGGLDVIKRAIKSARV